MSSRRSGAAVWIPAHIFARAELAAHRLTETTGVRVNPKDLVVEAARAGLNLSVFCTGDPHNTNR